MTDKMQSNFIIMYNSCFMQLQNISDNLCDYTEFNSLHTKFWQPKLEV